jgi:hypothetical protein
MWMHCLQDPSHRRLLRLVLLLAVAMVAQAEEKPHSFKKQAFISTIENRFSCLGLGEVFCRKVQIGSRNSKRQFETQAANARRLVRNAEEIMQALLCDLSERSKSWETTFNADCACSWCNSNRAPDTVV